MLAICCSSAGRRYPLTLLLALLIAVCSLIPLSLPEPITDVPFYDKWGHFLMYGTLSLVAWFEYAHSHRRPGRVLPQSLPAHSWLMLLFVSLVLPCLWGGLMELLQATCTTNRSGEWMDFWADCVGSVLGVLVAAVAGLAVRRRS